MLDRAECHRIRIRAEQQAEFDKIGPYSSRLRAGKCYDMEVIEILSKHNCGECKHKLTCLIDPYIGGGLIYSPVTELVEHEEAE